MIKTRKRTTGVVQHAAIIITGPGHQVSPWLQSGGGGDGVPINLGGGGGGGGGGKGGGLHWQICWQLSVTFSATGLEHDLWGSPWVIWMKPQMGWRAQCRSREGQQQWRTSLMSITPLGAAGTLAPHNLCHLRRVWAGRGLRAGWCFLYMLGAGRQKFAGAWGSRWGVPI